ncbi:choice-of-anchor G family protein, partial [Brachybacterium tyrofermentans]|uniref:choice-of-anchor G family protein n=1 Tax=Brachybacterium tyrofermentans TaxID=47848 RepID=UPI003FD03B87
MSSSPSDGHGEPKRGFPSRRSVVKGAAWSVPVAAASMAAPALAVSPADCEPGDLFDGVGRGRILTGDVLFLSLDEDQTSGVELLTLNGVTAQNPEGGVPGPSPQVPVSDEQNNNLSVTALDLVDVDLNGLTPPLADILELPVNNDAGVYKQYGYVNQDGTQRGASGYVTDDGSIRTDGGGAGGGMPTMATINLRQIIESDVVSALPGVPALLDAATGVDALNLQVGAVAGMAEQLQNCEADGNATLARDYLVSDLKAVVSPADESLLGSLISNIANNVVDLDLDLSGLTGALSDVLSGLGLVRIADTQVALSVDPGAITATPLPSINDEPVPTSIPIQIDFKGDTVTVDLAELVGGLNGAAPNSVLFRDLGTKPTAENLTGFLNALIQQLLERLLNAISVTVTAGARITVPVVGTVLVDGTLTISGTLAELRDGGGEVSLGRLPLTGLTRGLMTAVFNLVYGALDTALDDGGALKQVLVDGLIANLLEPVLALLSEVVKIRLN